MLHTTPISVLGPVERIHRTSHVRAAYDPDRDEYVLMDRGRPLPSLTELFREDPAAAKRYVLAAGGAWSSQTALVLEDAAHELREAAAYYYQVARERREPGIPLQMHRVHLDRVHHIQAFLSA